MSAEEVNALLAAHTTINMEIYYWWCTAIMIAIHAGFIAYEMGVSQTRNALASGVKNILAFAFMIPTFYMIGWWIYLAMPAGFTPNYEDGAGAIPWADAMGPNLADNATGVFWAAFTLFACTTASIFSGAVIERIRVSAFIVLAVLLGSVVWILGAAWGWHPKGWLVTQYGLHDVAAAGVVHTIAGFFALGVLINLGPRLGKFNADGSANDIHGHNLPLAVTGLMMIIIGFFGFLGACLIYSPGALGSWTNIYGAPATLSSFAFNTLMSMAGGIIGAYLVTKNPFWMMSGALGGIFSAAAGLDIYYPPLAFALGFVGGMIIPPGVRLLERMGIDDAVGAVSVHGFCGVWGVIACGIFAAGYPSAEGIPPLSLSGQLVGAIVFIVIGFVPGYVGSLLLRMLGILRVGDEVQRIGLDHAEVGQHGYPEFDQSKSDRAVRI